MDMPTLLKLKALPAIEGLNGSLTDEKVERIAKWIGAYNALARLEVRELTPQLLSEAAQEVGLGSFLKEQQLASLVQIAREEDFQGTVVDWLKSGAPLKILMERRADTSYVSGDVPCIHCGEPNVGNPPRCRHCGGYLTT